MFDLLILDGSIVSANKTVSSVYIMLSIDFPQSWVLVFMHGDSVNPYMFVNTVTVPFHTQVN